MGKTGESVIDKRANRQTRLAYLIWIEIAAFSGAELVIKKEEYFVIFHEKL